MKICADAGGTSVRIAYTNDDYTVLEKRKYPVSQFPGGETGFLSAVSHFLRETAFVCSPADIDTLVVCVAGPVDKNTVQFRNTNWIISSEQISKNFETTFVNGFRVLLLNDFEALAYGLAAIEENHVSPIFEREGRGDTKIACGPGTGLGMAALKQNGEGLEGITVFPSEGGHQSFPVETHVEREICENIMDEWVSYEHILSGQGLQLLFSHFSEKTNAPNITEQLPEDIIKLYVSGNVAAKKALEEFAYALGSFCGNMVLALGATRGVYLWGGILKSFPHEMLRNQMMRRFHLRGRAANYVANVPVYRIVNSDVALRGCAIFAAKMLSKA